MSFVAVVVVVIVDNAVSVVCFVEVVVEVGVIGSVDVDVEVVAAGGDKRRTGMLMVRARPMRVRRRMERRNTIWIRLSLKCRW